MPDYVGALELPVAAPASFAAAKTAGTGDPLRRILGEYLQACIRDQCQDAWAVISGGKNVVERVELNDPSDNTFVTSKLPCLVVMRPNRNRKAEWLADDLHAFTTLIEVLWIPSPEVQGARAVHEPFLHAIESAIEIGLWSGRTRSWVVTGDTDPIAATDGSFVNTHLGLTGYPHVTFDDSTVEIQMKDAPAKKYPSLKATITLQECSDPDRNWRKVTNTAEGTTRTNAATANETQVQTYPLPT